MPTPLSRPRYKTPKPALPHVPSFQCECGTVHQAADGKLPVGWSQSAGTVYCLDCTRAGIAHRQIKRRDGRSDRVRLRAEVVDLLREGQSLMPPGAAVRVAWIQRVNALLSEVSASAA